MRHLPLATIEKFTFSYEHLLYYTASKIDSNTGVFGKPKVVFGKKMDMMDTSALNEARNNLMANREVAQAYIRDPNGAALENCDLSVAQAIPRAIFGDWLVFGYTDDYAICMDSETRQFYHAKWLKDRLSKKFNLPAMAQFALVPYDGHWIIDGLYAFVRREWTPVQVHALGVLYQTALESNQVVVKS